MLYSCKLSDLADRNQVTGHQIHLVSILVPCPEVLNKVGSPPAVLQRKGGLAELAVDEARAILCTSRIREELPASSRVDAPLLGTLDVQPLLRAALNLCNIRDLLLARIGVAGRSLY